METKKYQQLDFGDFLRPPKNVTKYELEDYRRIRKDVLADRKQIKGDGNEILVTLPRDPRRFAREEERRFEEQEKEQEERGPKVPRGQFN